MPYSEFLLVACARMFSSCVCCLRRATWAAITRWRSAIRVHCAQLQSLHWQYRLWPFSQDTTPWLRQRAHLGVLGGFLSGNDGWTIYELSLMITTKPLQLKGGTSCCNCLQNVMTSANAAPPKSWWRLQEANCLGLIMRQQAITNYSDGVSLC